MLAVLAGILFPYGPPPGPIVPSADRPPRGWRAFLKVPSGYTAKSFAVPQGILVYAGTLALLDPKTGRVRWQIPVEGDFIDLSGGDTITLTLGDAVLRLDPKTGRTVARMGRKYPQTKLGEPYVFPSTRSFSWRDGRVLEYEDTGEGPVGIAFMSRRGKDTWGGAYVSEVVLGHAGIAIGSLRDQSGTTAEADDSPERTYIARLVCADRQGVWAVRQGFGRAGRLVRILPLGFEETGPSVTPTAGLPAWTREGIVYAQGRSLYRFDGHVSRRVLTYAHPSVDGADLRSARLTPWGLVRTADGSRGRDAWVLVRLDPLPL